MSKAATAATKMSAVAIVASVTQAIMLALSTRRHKLTAVHVWLDNNNSPVKRRTLLPRRRVFIFVWNFFFKKRKKRKEISTSNGIDTVENETFWRALAQFIFFKKQKNWEEAAASTRLMMICNGAKDGFGHTFSAPNPLIKLTSSRQTNNNTRRPSIVPVCGRQTNSSDKFVLLSSGWNDVLGRIITPNSLPDAHS